MKSVKLYIGLLSIVAIASCEDMIERKSLSSPSVDTFYTNATEIQGGINGCYGTLNLYAGGYDDFVYSWDGLTETVWLRGCSRGDELLGGAMDFTASYPLTFWKQCYVGIGRCNLMIDVITNSDVTLTEAEENQFLGEAYFLRGYYYLNLVENFGDVQYTEEPIDEISEASQLTRTPAATVYQNIYADFDKAAALLKNSTVTTFGRASWGAALAYKSRAALNNGDYATAKAAANTLIQSNLYELYPQYETLFTESVMRSSANKEYIFGYDYDKAAGRTHSFLQFAESRYGGGWCTVVPTENMLDSYECIDGKYIDESPLFDKAKRFENRDPRLHYSNIVPGDMYHDVRYDTHMDSVYVWNYSTNTMIKNMDSYSYTQYCSFTGYLPKKYAESGLYPNGQCENPFYLCRYAEVLLNYAEACIESGNDLDLDDARAKINMIRQRSDVNMPALPSGMTQSQLRKALRHERKIELAYENLRLQDLRRWKTAEKQLNQPKFGRPFKGALSEWPDVSFDENGDPVYDYNSYEPHPSSDYRILLMCSFNPDRDYLWPIPQREQLLNSQLTQNPGYSSAN